MPAAKALLGGNFTQWVRRNYKVGALRREGQPFFDVIGNATGGTHLTISG